MSVNEKVLKALQELKARADAGDVKAKFELKRAVTAIKQQVTNQRAQQAKKRREEQLVGLVQSGALDHLLIGSGDKDGDVEMDGDEGGEEVVGWNPKSIEEGTYDELEQANDLMRAEPTADDLSHKAKLRSLRHAALNERAAFTRTNPVSILNGSLGNQATVWTGPGLASDQPTSAQVALWTAADDAETAAVTVAFSPVTPATPTFVSVANNQSILRPYGIVQFGSRAFSVAAEVDIQPGCLFTVPASSVSLQVALEDTSLVALAAVGNMQLAGMLSFNAGQKNTPVTRTKIGLSIGPGEVTTVEVPYFAKSVTFWRSTSPGPVAPAAFTLAFLDSRGVTRYSYDQAAGTYMTVPVPIAADIFAIAYAGTGGVTVTNPRLIFNLCF